jgi:hypothetical protein
MIQLGSRTPRRRRRVPSLFTGLTALRRSVQVPGSSTVGRAPMLEALGFSLVWEADRLVDGGAGCCSDTTRGLLALETG